MEKIHSFKNKNQTYIFWTIIVDDKLWSAYSKIGPCIHVLCKVVCQPLHPSRSRVYSPALESGLALQPASVKRLCQVWHCLQEPVGLCLSFLKPCHRDGSKSGLVYWREMRGLIWQSQIIPAIPAELQMWKEPNQVQQSLWGKPSVGQQNGPTDL